METVVHKHIAITDKSYTPYSFKCVCGFETSYAHIFREHIGLEENADIPIDLH